jgi:beta-glucosidase
MKHCRIFFLFWAIFVSSLFMYKVQSQDHVTKANQKAKQLLDKLTLEEKIAQLILPSHPVVQTFISGEGVISVDSLEKYFPHGVGGLNIDRNLPPETYVKVANSIQKYNQTRRVWVPALFVGEGLHGFMSRGATVFPQAIALGCTWDMDLLERLYSTAALEASARGVKMFLTPVLDIGREPRFGRIEEMYSEDTYLTAECGKAAVYGFQGRDGIPGPNQVAATLKHFVGHGIPEGGRNVAPVNISPYDLLNDHVAPFEACLEAGALAIMPSYNEINGVPNHGNQWLMNDILREKLGFKGVVIADQNAIDEMYRTHFSAQDAPDAALKAIHSNIDIDLRYTKGTFDHLDYLVSSGQLDEAVINRAVERVLTLKYIVNLFEKPFADASHMLKVTNSSEHKKIALEAAEKAMVLLKNEGNLLPLQSGKYKKVAVIGPNAKGVHFGGYTAEPRHGVDVLDGISQYAKGKFEVVYAEGCKIAKEESSFWRDDVHTPNDEASDLKLIKEAVDIAKTSDVIILAIGENVSFSREAWGENHLGDRDDLDLLGRQDLLVQSLLKTGKPIVALVFGGRPLSFNYVAENVPAIFQCFYLGQEGGHAVANIIFGETNPSGKLATTIPVSVGQIPCFYSRKPSRMRSYIYHPGSKPLYAFGHGLSYTTFEYANLRSQKDTIAMGESNIFWVDITNTGNKPGEEIVQMYIRDVVSEGVRPILELKGFDKVLLKPGETKTVAFKINPEKLEYYNPKLEKTIEKGQFNVFVGPNSFELLEGSFYVK